MILSPLAGRLDQGLIGAYVDNYKWTYIKIHEQVTINLR